MLICYLESKSLRKSAIHAYWKVKLNIAAVILRIPLIYDS